MADPNVKTKVQSKSQTTAEGTPFLEVVVGADAGLIRDLESAQALIGRATNATLRLDDEGVSRHHAKLVMAQDIVNLMDLGSTNGTYLNGKLIDVAVVREGDRIQIGSEVVLRFGYRVAGEEVGGDAPDEPPFTARELDVVRLVTEGLTNAQIGERLHISPLTVMTHLTKIYGRVEVKSRAALTRLVLERGWIQGSTLSTRRTTRRR